MTKKRDCGSKKSRNALRKIKGKFSRSEAISVLTNIGCTDPDSRFGQLIHEGWIQKSGTLFYIN
jgi:hypothetical protein